MIFNEVANLEIFDQKSRKVLLRRVPTALPAANHAYAKTNRMNFLTHYLTHLFALASIRQIEPILHLADIFHRHMNMCRAP